MMWHPDDEAQACSDLAAFLELRRATTGDDSLTPESLRAWHHTDPTAFAAALHQFGPITPETLFAAWDRLKPPA